MFAERITKVQNLMRSNNIDALLLSVGADLPYFIGYEAMPLERLTMLVIRDEGNPMLIIPQLERARVTERPDIFDICEWGETEDPIEIVATALTGSVRVAIGDTTWTRFTIELLKRMPSVDLLRANPITSQLRSIKSTEELDRLQQAANAVDKIAHRLQNGQIELIGKTEKQVSEELGRQIIDEGHNKVNFAIVAAGENAASPHHEAGDRRIQKSEIVLVISEEQSMETTESDTAQISHAVCGLVTPLRNLSKCTQYCRKLNKNKFRKLFMEHQPSRLTGWGGKSYLWQVTENSLSTELVTELEWKHMKNPT